MVMARVERRCDLGQHCAPPHGWERLNPETEEPYRRGRVVFWCPYTARHGRRKPAW